jgi:hypothetical protein
MAKGIEMKMGFTYLAKRAANYWWLAVTPVSFFTALLSFVLETESFGTGN